MEGGRRLLACAEVLILDDCCLLKVLFQAFLYEELWGWLVWLGQQAHHVHMRCVYTFT